MPTFHRRLQLVAADALVEAAAATTTDRTLRGLVLPYAADGRTSAGRVRASAGRVRWASDLRRIKVNVDHDRGRPVGYLTALRETPDGLTAELHIAATPDGDAALLEAREGTRDALSVELEDVELDDDGELVSAELAAVALVPLPAFSDARIAAERDDQDDDDQAPPARYTPPAPVARRPAPLLAARTRPRAERMSFDAAAAQLTARLTADRSAASLTAALADITPVSTNWAAVAPYQWVDEVWTPSYAAMPWANAVTQGVLTNMRVTGFKFVEPGPKILPYAGNKAAIPTDGTLSYAAVTVDAVRHAVGADFDRIWEDFGQQDVIATWLRLVTLSYAQVLNDLAYTAISGAATDGGTAPDVITAITVAAQKLKTAGASVTFIAVAADLYGQWLAMPTAEVPWWLPGSSSVNLSGQSSNVNNLNIFESPELPAGTVLAGDRKAVTQYVPRGNPFTVRAIDLAKGGTDVGVFGYSAELVNDARGIVEVTVPPALP
jgi:hypothetical protein